MTWFGGLVRCMAAVDSVLATKLNTHELANFTYYNVLIISLHHHLVLVAPPFKMANALCTQHFSCLFNAWLMIFWHLIMYNFNFLNCSAIKYFQISNFISSQYFWKPTAISWWCFTTAFEGGKELHERIWWWQYPGQQKWRWYVYKIVYSFFIHFFSY